MRNFYSAVLLALVAMAYAPAPAAETPRASAAGDESAIKMQGVDLYMHSDDPTYGERKEPTFWVHAERGRLEEKLKVWSIENAEALVYREAEDNLRLQAREGMIDESNQVARLHGGVRATTGELVMNLEDIEWNNHENIARSESPVSLTDGVNDLSGDSVSIFPKDDRVELGAGNGRIRLAELGPAQQETTSQSERSMGQYKALRIEWQGKLVGNLKGTLQRITDGAHLIVLADDPADNLDIKAKTVEFDYAAPEDRMPTRMRLDGDVEFRHQDGVIRSESADIDFEASIAKFTGNPRAEITSIRGIQVDYIQIDLNTEELVMGGPGHIDEIQITDTEKDAAPQDGAH